MENINNMTVLFKKLLNLRTSCLLKRSLQLTSIQKSYEGDGKTTVTVLNNNFDYGLMIDNLSNHGFILNNGVRVLGPIMLFPKTMLSWNIASSSDINEESLSLILNLEPKLDIFVIGLDDDYPYNAPFLLNIKDLLKKHKISTEILPVHRACSTFNFLNSENRYVAAALIPPKVKYSQDVLLEGKNKKLKPIEDGKDEDIKEIDFHKDPLVSDALQSDMSANILKKQKENEESLKVRSPWRKEGAPPKASDIKNKKP